MTQSVLQKLKDYFSSSGVPNSPIEVGTPYFNESEKNLLRQRLLEANTEASAVADARGYKVHPRMAHMRKPA